MAAECPNCGELVSFAAGLLFRPGISVCVCVSVCAKRRETRFWGGSGSFKAGVPVILMDVGGT